MTIWVTRTFRRQQLDVWATMNICSGNGFLLASRLQRRFSLCKLVLEHLWTLLTCAPKQLNTDNRLHDPRSAAVLGITLHFCCPDVSMPVVQTSDCCYPNVQPVSPKWSSQKIVAQTSVAQMSWCPNFRTPLGDHYPIKWLCDIVCCSAHSELVPYAEVINSLLVQVLNWSSNVGDKEPGQQRPMR